ncbi:MAG TPA: DUF4440 domain-containing protein [Pyrinomonadaceae bacterium]|jgi:uncharacterized protein (TIGR02246 family)
MKANLFLIFITGIFFAHAASAQASPDLLLENGVAPHKGLDEVYRRFSDGYRKLDADSVAVLYTESAAYLVPDNDAQFGRQKILENFKSFFDYVRMRNEKVQISFRILQRQVDKDMAYDVGIFILTSINSKGESHTGRGKFVVVARREKDDVWRLQVDGYNNLLSISSNNQKPNS